MYRDLLHTYGNDYKPKLRTFDRFDVHAEQYATMKIGKSGKFNIKMDKGIDPVPLQAGIFIICFENVAVFTFRFDDSTCMTKNADGEWVVPSEDDCALRHTMKLWEVDPNDTSFDNVYVLREIAAHLKSGGDVQIMAIRLDDLSPTVTSLVNEGLMARHYFHLEAKWADGIEHAAEIEWELQESVERDAEAMREHLTNSPPTQSFLERLLGRKTY